MTATYTLKRHILVLVILSVSLLSQAQPKLVGMMSQGPNQNGTIIQYIGGTNALSHIDSFPSISHCSVMNNMTMTEAANGIMYGLNYGGSNYSSGSMLTYDAANPGSSYNLGLEFGGGPSPVNSLGSLLLASDGFLYGQNYKGGSYLDGCLFSYSALAGTVSIQYDDLFCAPYGGCPNAAQNYPGQLVQAKDSFIYGVDIGDVNFVGFGYYSGSCIFRFGLETAVTYLYLDTTGIDSLPYSIIECGADTFYGLSTNFISRYIPGSPGVYTKLYYLPQNANPNGTLVRASNGLLYGLTSGDGTYGKGTIFSYNTHTGAYTVLYSFGATATDGQNPTGDLMQASDGNLYGVTSAGGDDSLGTIFQYNIGTAAYTKEVSLDSNAYGPLYGHLVEYQPVISHHIDMQPVDAGLCANNWATFTVHDSSSIPASIQWQLSTDQGLIYTNVAYANYNTYTRYATTADIGYKYRAVFSNGDTSNAATIVINDQSTGPAPLSYIWSWGDSSANSVGDTVSHTYASAGNYNVCVTVTDGQGCAASYCDTNVYLFKNQSGQMVQIETTPQSTSSIADIDVYHFSLYPNPVQETFTLHNDYTGSFSLQIVNMLGAMVKEYEISAADKSFDVRALSTGIYEVRVIANGQTLKVLKLVKD